MAITREGQAAYALEIGTGSESLSLPGTVLEGDIVRIALACDRSFGATNKILTSGYEAIYDLGTFYPELSVQYKRMGSTPDSSVLIEQLVDRKITVNIRVFRGVDTTTAIDATPTYTSGGSGSPNAPSFTSVTNGALHEIIGGIDDDDVTGGGAPSGWDDYFVSDTGQSSTTDGASVQSALKLMATAGSEDPGAFSGGDDEWEAVHYAWRPATLAAYTLTAEAGSFALTGQDAGLLVGYVLDAGAGAFTLTGQAAGLFHDYILSAEAGAFIFTGIEADLTRARIPVPPPGIDDYPPIIPAVASGGTLTPEMVEWLRQLVDEVRELRAASNDYETRISDLEP